MSSTHSPHDLLLLLPLQKSLSCQINQTNSNKLQPQHAETTQHHRHLSKSCSVNSNLPKNNNKLQQQLIQEHHYQQQQQQILLLSFFVVPLLITSAIAATIVVAQAEETQNLTNTASQKKKKSNKSTATSSPPLLSASNTAVVEGETAQEDPVFGVLHKITTAKTTITKKEAKTTKPQEQNVHIHPSIPSSNSISLLTQTAEGDLKRPYLFFEKKGAAAAAYPFPSQRVGQKLRSYIFVYILYLYIRVSLYRSGTPKSSPLLDRSYYYFSSLPLYIIISLYRSVTPKSSSLLDRSYFSSSSPSSSILHTAASPCNNFELKPSISSSAASITPSSTEKALKYIISLAYPHHPIAAPASAGTKTTKTLFCNSLHCAKALHFCGYCPYNNHHHYQHLHYYQGSLRLIHRE